MRHSPCACFSEPPGPATRSSALRPSTNSRRPSTLRRGLSRGRQPARGTCSNGGRRRSSARRKSNSSAPGRSFARATGRPSPAPGKSVAGYTGQLIPASYFGSHYGPNHWFRVYSLPFTYVSGYPRFQLGGYWFSVVDPIPEYLDNDWYRNDDMYYRVTTVAGTTCMTAVIPVGRALPSVSRSRPAGFVAPSPGALRGHAWHERQYDETSQVLDLRCCLGADRG